MSSVSSVACELECDLWRLVGVSALHRLGACGSPVWPPQGGLVHILTCQYTIQGWHICYNHLSQTSVRSPTNTFLTAVAGTAARPRIVPDMPTFKAPRLRRTTQSLKPLRSLSPTSAIRGKCHHANFKMRKPTLSAHAAGRHSTAVDHAAQLPAQRGPWKAHGSHAQHPVHCTQRGSMALAH